MNTDDAIKLKHGDVVYYDYFGETKRAVVDKVIYDPKILAQPMIEFLYPNNSLPAQFVRKHK